MSKGLSTRYVQTGAASNTARAIYASRIASASCANADGPLFVSPKDGYRVMRPCLLHWGTGCPEKGRE